MSDKNVTRRDFLKQAGIAIGGITIGSMVTAASCSNETTTENPPPVSTTATSTERTTAGTTTTVPPTTSPTGAPISTPPPSTSTTPPASTTTTPPASTGTTTQPPKTGNANLMQVPGCESYVALDRLYSADGIWVVKQGVDTIQIGMSDPLQTLTSVVIACWLTDPGTVLRVEDPFGSVEAEKMSVDLLSPVSGKVLTINENLMSAARFQSPINSDPYGAGWMATIKLSNPTELKTLYTPQYYAYLEAGTKWTGPVPQKYP